jgi:hypothetical protein
MAAGTRSSRLRRGGAMFRCTVRQTGAARMPTHFLSARWRGMGDFLQAGMTISEGRQTSGCPTALRPEISASILPLALSHPVLGAAVAVLLLAGLGAGLWLDDRMGTRPVATLLCSLAAAHVAVLVVYRRVSAALREIGEVATRRHDNAESR